MNKMRYAWNRPVNSEMSGLYRPAVSKLVRCARLLGIVQARWSARSLRRKRVAGCDR